MCQGSCSPGDQNQMSVLHWAVPGPKMAAEALVLLCLLQWGRETHIFQNTLQDVQLQFSESLTELPSWELKSCLGLKPKVMNFRYWNILSASHPPLLLAYSNSQVKNQHSTGSPEDSKVTQTILWRLFLLATSGKALWKTRQCSACKGNPGYKISKVKFNPFL